MLAGVPCMPSVVALDVVQGYRQADCPFQDLVEQHGSSSRVWLCGGRRAGLQERKASVRTRAELKL